MYVVCTCMCIGNRESSSDSNSDSQSGSLVIGIRLSIYRYGYITVLPIVISMQYRNCKRDKCILISSNCDYNRYNV